MESKLDKKLAIDLTLQEVYFALSMYKGLAEHCIPTALFQVISNLVYHQRPPLPLLESDKTKKLIYPTRTLWHNKVDKVKMQLMKFFR